MPGRKRSRLKPSAYSWSGGWLDVHTITTPSSNITWNRRPRMIASPMSFTNSSSKHSTRTAWLSSLANACKGSWVPVSWNKRWWTQAMKW